MRLIDADALKNYMAEKYVMYDHTFDDIDAQPTIEPKKGKWIKIVDLDTVQCSECFEEFDYIDGLCYLCHGQELPDYCPNCGAKMERSEEC